MKFNVDGCFIEHTGSASLGVVARDENCEHILSSSWRVLFQCRDAEEAEALACLEAICLVIDRAHKPVIIEMDCRSVFLKLMSPEKDRSVTGHINSGDQASWLITL